jgi:hypothetical protein
VEVNADTRPPALTIPQKPFKNMVQLKELFWGLKDLADADQVEDMDLTQYPNI